MSPSLPVHVKAARSLPEICRACRECLWCETHTHTHSEAVVNLVDWWYEEFLFSELVTSNLC